MAYSIQLALVNDRSGLIVMTVLFCLISITAVGLRFYSRRLTRLGLGADDWLALTAMVFVLGLNGLLLVGTIQGAITGHSQVVNDWPLTSDLEHLAQKYKYGFQMIEKITFGLIKLSILFLWQRMFGRVKSFVILCWVMMGIVAAWSIAFFFATLFQCGTNWSWNWAPIGVFLTQCIDSLDALTVFTATDVFTDFIIMFMPVPIIWKLHMPIRKKAGVTSIFMVGLFTIGAGIARVYMYLVTSYDKADNPDFIADLTLCLLWSEIEANVAMLVCCMPTLAPIIAKGHDGFIHTIHHLGSGVFRKWTLLSRGRGNGTASTESEERTKAQSYPASVELRDVAHASPPWPAARYDGWGPFLGASSSITATGYSDLEAQFDQTDGIVSRTEIYRTSEPKDPRSDSQEQIYGRLK